MRFLLLAMILLAACGDPLEIMVPPSNPFADHDLLVTESTCPGLGDRCDRLVLLSASLPPVVLVAPEPGQWIEDANLSAETGSVAFTRWHGDAEGAVVGTVEVITSIRSAPERRPIGSGKEPAISPDGTLVALTRLDDGGVDLRALDGSLLRQLAFKGRGAHRPRWSPDGATVLLIAGENRQLMHVQVEGGVAAPFDGLQSVREATYAAAGDRVLVSTDDGVYVMDADGGNRVPRVRLAGTTFAFAPGGEAIAYLTEAIGGRARLLLSDPVGAPPRALTDVAVWGGFSWSPTGEWIAYSSGATIWAVRVSDAARVAVHESEGAQRDPLWVR